MICDKKLCSSPQREPVTGSWSRDFYAFFEKRDRREIDEDGDER